MSDRRCDECVVYLKDGRTFDISGWTAADAMAHLQALGVTLDDIAKTVHRPPVSGYPVEQ